MKSKKEQRKDLVIFIVQTLQGIATLILGVAVILSKR